MPNDTAKIEPDFMDATGEPESALTDGTFIHFLTVARTPPECTAVVRRMVLRKYGEVSALVQSGIDDDLLRGRVLATISASLGGALDALLPPNPAPQEEPEVRLNAP